MSMKWFKFSVFFQLMGIGICALIPIYWRESLHYSATTIGTLNAIGIGIAFLAPIAFGKIGSRIAPERPIFISFICYSSGLLLLVLFSSVYLQVLFFSVLQFSKWGFHTLVPVGVMKHLKGSVGFEYGKYRRIGSLGFLIGLLAIGYITDRVGNYALFYIAAVCMLIAALPYQRLIKIAPNTDKGISFKVLLQKALIRNFQRYHDFF